MRILFLDPLQLFSSAELARRADLRSRRSLSASFTHALRAFEYAHQYRHCRASRQIACAALQATGCAASRSARSAYRNHAALRDAATCARANPIASAKYTFLTHSANASCPECAFKRFCSCAPVDSFSVVLRARSLFVLMPLCMRRYRVTTCAFCCVRHSRCISSPPLHLPLASLALSAPLASSHALPASDAFALSASVANLAVSLQPGFLLPLFSSFW